MRAIGVTNFDAAHLALGLGRRHSDCVQSDILFRAGPGGRVGDLSALCARSSVKLLAYGTLNGGFLSEKWLGKPEPALKFPTGANPSTNASLMQRGAGTIYQGLLAALDRIAKTHTVSTVKCRNTLGAGAAGRRGHHRWCAYWRE